MITSAPKTVLTALRAFLVIGLTTPTFGQPSDGLASFYKGKKIAMKQVLTDRSADGNRAHQGSALPDATVEGDHGCRHVEIDALEAARELFSR